MLEKARGALQSLKGWRMRPPPKGPNTWPGGAGTPESHLIAAAVLSGRSGGGFVSMIYSMTIYIAC
jgi:hypothetical protein